MKVKVLVELIVETNDDDLLVEIKQLVREDVRKSLEGYHSIRVLDVVRIERATDW